MARTGNPRAAAGPHRPARQGIARHGMTADALAPALSSEDERTF